MGDREGDRQRETHTHRDTEICTQRDRVEGGEETGRETKRERVTRRS